MDLSLLDSLGPWIGNVSLVTFLFVALARGWLITPASIQRFSESQESRIDVAERREQEWRQAARDALKVAELQGKQLETAVEQGETMLKILEALPRSNKEGS